MEVDVEMKKNLRSPLPRHILDGRGDDVTAEREKFAAVRKERSRSGLGSLRIRLGGFPRVVSPNPMKG